MNRLERLVEDATTHGLAANDVAVLISFAQLVADCIDATDWREDASISMEHSTIANLVRRLREER